MKTILVLSILFSAIALPTLCQTPQSNVETDIVGIKTEIAVIKTEIKNIDEKIDDKFEGLEKNFQQNFDNVQKNFDRQNNIIIACIGIPLGILAIVATIWGIFAHRRSAKDQILEKQIETLTREIETLKQQQIVRP